MDLQLSELPEDVLREIVAGLVGAATTGRELSQLYGPLAQTSKQFNNLLLAQTRQLQILKERETLEYQYRDVDVDRDEHELLYSYRRIPEPKLEYGLPDVDVFGNVIPENKESNDQWHYLIQMLREANSFYTTGDAVFEAVRPYLPTITQMDVFIFHPSFYLNDANEKEILQILLNAETPNESLARAIYWKHSTRVFPRDPDDPWNLPDVEALFIEEFKKRGAFGSIITLSEENLAEMRQSPYYPHAIREELIYLYTTLMHDEDADEDLVDDVDKILTEQPDLIVKLFEWIRGYPIHEQLISKHVLRYLEQRVRDNVPLDQLDEILFRRYSGYRDEGTFDYLMSRLRDAHSDQPLPDDFRTAVLDFMASVDLEYLEEIDYHLRRLEN